MTGKRTSPRPILHITQEIIDQAVPKDSGHCVYADAIAEQIPNATAITVDLATMRWSDRKQGQRFVYLTPQQAQANLIGFDQGVRPEPHTLKLAGAVQITPITRHAKEAKSSAERRAELEAKEAAGTLTPTEAGALQRRRNHDEVAAAKERPSTVGPATISKDGGRPVKVGGMTPPLATLAHGRGRVRNFGLRYAGLTDGVIAVRDES